MNREKKMRFRLFGAIAAIVIAVVGTANAQAPAQGKVTLQWFAQSAFKLTTPGGKVIMIDPWLTGNPKTPAEWKDLDKLGKIDLILVTHAHGDHLGDAVELAYRRGDALAKRAKLMEAWAGYVARVATAKTDNVKPLRGAA